MGIVIVTAIVKRKTDMIYYLFAILNNINTTLLVLCILLCILALACTLLGIDNNEDSFKEKGKAFFKWWIAILMLITFVPSQRQMAFVIAAPYIVENENIQDAGDNLTEIIKEGAGYLKEVLHEKRTQTVSNGN